MSATPPAGANPGRPAGTPGPGPAGTGNLGGGTATPGGATGDGGRSAPGVEEPLPPTTSNATEPKKAPKSSSGEGSVVLAGRVGQYHDSKTDTTFVKNQPQSVSKDDAERLLEVTDDHGNKLFRVPSDS